MLVLVCKNQSFCTKRQQLNLDQALYLVESYSLLFQEYLQLFDRLLLFRSCNILSWVISSIKYFHNWPENATPKYLSKMFQHYLEIVLSVTKFSLNDRKKSCWFFFVLWVFFGISVFLISFLALVLKLWFCIQIIWQWYYLGFPIFIK